MLFKMGVCSGVFGIIDGQWCVKTYCCAKLPVVLLLLLANDPFGTGHYLPPYNLTHTPITQLFVP